MIKEEWSHTGPRGFTQTSLAPRLPISLCQFNQEGDSWTVRLKAVWWLLPFPRGVYMLGKDQTIGFPSWEEEAGRPVKGQRCSAHPLWPEIRNRQEGRWKSVLNSVGSHHLLVGVSHQQSIFFRKKPEEEAHTCLAWIVTVVSYPCLWLFHCLL